MGQVAQGQPHSSSQVMSPRNTGGGQQAPQGDRRNSPRGGYGGGSNTQTRIHQTWFMVSDILHLRRRDEELAAQQVEFEEQQANNHAVHQRELQREFEEASHNLRSELGLQAEQQLNFYAQEERAYFEAHLLSLRAQAETAVSTTQRNLQQQFINQTLEVQARAEAAEQAATRTAQEHYTHVQQISTEADQEIGELRRELQEAQYATEMQTSNYNTAMQTMIREREVHQTNLEQQAERWRGHTEEVTEEARRLSTQLRTESAQQRAEYEEEIAEGDVLLNELRELVGTLQDELQEWEDWWGGEEPHPPQQS